MTKPIERLEDLKPDPKNANRGTSRGHGIIEQSISRHGAGRSGLAAKDGTMIAGSQTLEEMIAAGIKLKPVHFILGTATIGVVGRRISGN